MSILSETISLVVREVKNDPFLSCRLNFNDLIQAFFHRKPENFSLSPEFECESDVSSSSEYTFSSDTSRPSMSHLSHPILLASF